MKDETRDTAIYLNGAQVRNVRIKQWGPFSYLTSETQAPSGLLWRSRHVNINAGRWCASIQLSRILI